MAKKRKSVYIARRVTALVVLILLLTCVVLAITGKVKRNKANKEAMNSLSVSFLEEDQVNAKFTGTSFKASENGGRFEYGTEVIDPTDLVVSHTCNVTVVGDKKIDTSREGDCDIVYKLEKTDRYGKTVSKEVSAHYTVSDTAPPVIELAAPTVTMFLGEQFDPMENVIAARDPVDGEVACMFDSNVDASSEGSYTVVMTARDRNGNECRVEYAVDVEEFAPAETPSDGIYTYAFMVNKAANTVTVYKRDQNGEYTIPYKAMVCSTGEDTPTGTYYTYDDPSNSSWSPYYPWWPLYGGVYGMYSTGIVDSILFHSVPYYSPDPGDLEYDEYNKLGTSASAGCVRLSVRDMMWVFSHCPKGTMVVFYDDADDPGPLGKPEPVRIDTESPNRGWDPTDPDPDNPWNS
ncbi:MAG: L,D-transpeptidase [Oscillospiraceae bacterium]|nr:L,D-transpeptidase [Oscillospiraceae bacterium]